ncbi:MAG TPA: endolytic transglycosylase MltG [Chloroflexota bacterium]|nr:endolytic transglycosylase MltG [Chloroflexota bacterium]
MSQPYRRPPGKSRHISAGGVVLLVVLAVLLLGAFGATRGVLSRRSVTIIASPANAVSAPPAGSVVAVSVQPGESTAQIARDLQDKGLVPNDAVFLGFVKLRGSGTNFQPGLHKIAAGASMDQIVAELDQPVTPPEIRITLPEGRRTEEDAAAAANAGIGTAQAFTDLAAHPDPAWKYDFLVGLPKGASLEGFLFPDTYLLPAGTPKSADLIKRMLDDFQKRVTPDVRQQIAAHKHSLYDALIIASIVEREAKAPEERPLIAGVYWNRLAKGMGLFADPTVQYAVGKPSNWWPQLSANDLKVNSPFNTYLKQGLPPSPICNPGLASIQAAANPQGDFFYFVAKNDGSGQHAFARTLNEHNANRAKYGQ